VALPLEKNQVFDLPHAFAKNVKRTDHIHLLIWMFAG